MRIAIVGPAHPLRGGGLATFNERLARQLQSEGHTVKLFTFSLQYPKALFPGKTQLSDEPAPADLDIAVMLNSIGPLSWINTAHAILAGNFDVVIYRYWMPFMAPSLGSVARLVAKGKRVPRQVAIVDNALPHEPFPAQRPLAKYFLKAMDKLVAMSKAVVADIHSLDPKASVKLTPHPLYDNFGEKMDRGEALASLGLPANARTVLFFGFIRHYKGLDLLLEAMLDPRVQALNLTLLIAGEYYEDSSAYEVLLANPALKDKVLAHTHFIANDDVRTYFSAADLVAQPYRSATQSGVTQIAYHFEVPMLVTRVGGLEEMIPMAPEVGGYAVEPNPEAIATAIEDYFSFNRKAAFTEVVKRQKVRYGWAEFVAAVLG